MNDKWLDANIRARCEVKRLPKTPTDAIVNNALDLYHKGILKRGSEIMDWVDKKIKHASNITKSVKQVKGEKQNDSLSIKFNARS